MRECGDRPTQWAQTRERGGNHSRPVLFARKVLMVSYSKEKKRLLSRIRREVFSELWADLCVWWRGVWESGLSFRSQYSTCMPWYAKLNRYRRKAVKTVRVLRFAHARTYANRHIGSRAERDAFPTAYDVCCGIH